MAVEFDLSDSFFVKRSKKYEDIYEIITNRKKIFSMSQLFTLCAVIGFMNNEKIAFTDKGKDIRSEYFKQNELMNIYTIMIKCQEINASIEDFADIQFIKDAFKHIEEYAEGGMKVLCEEVFDGNWCNGEFNELYDKYELDILSYIYDCKMKDVF